jgi:hypothetical protein
MPLDVDLARLLNLHIQRVCARVSARPLQKALWRSLNAELLDKAGELASPSEEELSDRQEVFEVRWCDVQPHVVLSYCRPTCVYRPCPPGTEHTVSCCHLVVKLECVTACATQKSLAVVDALGLKGVAEEALGDKARFRLGTGRTVALACTGPLNLRSFFLSFFQVPTGHGSHARASRVGHGACGHQPDARQVRGRGTEARPHYATRHKTRLKLHVARQGAFLLQVQDPGRLPAQRGQAAGGVRRAAGQRGVGRRQLHA